MPAVGFIPEGSSIVKHDDHAHYDDEDYCYSSSWDYYDCLFFKQLFVRVQIVGVERISFSASEADRAQPKLEGDPFWSSATVPKVSSAP